MSPSPFTGVWRLVPNKQLRAVRERMRSRESPDDVMSRQELADQVNSYLFEHTGREFSLDANYVGKLERGVIRWPHKLYREAFRVVLRAASDGALGFANPRRTTTAASDVNRLDFLRAAALIGAGSFLTPTTFDILAPAEPTPVPSRIGRDEIEHIRTAAQMFSGWDHAYGGGFVREAVMAQLRWSARLLDTGAAEPVRVELQEAVGHLAHVTAFMAFDAYAWRDADGIFKFALACAEASGNPHLRAKVLSSMARMAIWRGNFDLGMSYADLGLDRAVDLTATEQAMLFTAKARALGKLSRSRDTLLTVDAADEAFGRSDPAEDPPWMAYYDAAQHAGDTGHALFDIAVRGYPTEARDRLGAAVAGHTASFPRSRAISLTKLATLVMARGDPREATELGTRALEAIGPLRSRRAASELRVFQRYAATHVRIPEVADLRLRIAETIG